MNDDAPHIRHLPDLMQDIIKLDRDLDELKGSTDWRDAMTRRDLKRERAKLTEAAHRLYGHTPARGDRGPSSAGAIAA